MITYLAYGSIGLGLSLAILNFHLLRNEQLQPNPRQTIIRAVYVFMVFTLLLTSLGFASEYLDRTKEIWRLANNLSELNDSLDNMKKYVSKLEIVISKFDKMKHSLELLTSFKGDKLNRINTDLNSDLKSIKEEFTYINETMKKQLGEK